MIIKVALAFLRVTDATPTSIKVHSVSGIRTGWTMVTWRVTDPWDPSLPPILTLACFLFYCFSIVSTGPIPYSCLKASCDCNFVSILSSIPRVQAITGFLLSFCMFSLPAFRNYEWDYRWMDYPPQAKDLKHPSDQSIFTYRGHSVLRTLIRCYFSPAYR